MRMLWMMAMMFLLSSCNQNHLYTSFLTPVCIKPYKMYRYHTCEDIEFIVDDTKYKIPKGFDTDLASIPRFAWSIMSPAHSSLIRPAIVHDWFYRMTCDFNRKETDLIFYHMLINDGISKTRASLMYYGVRLFGAEYYNEDYCES